MSEGLDCAALYNTLIQKGYPASAAQMAGKAHNNATFLEEVGRMPYFTKKLMQQCAGKTAEQLIQAAAEKMTDAQKQASRAHAEKKLQEHKEKLKSTGRAGAGEGVGVTQPPGATSSHAAYEEIIEIIDEQDNPFSFLTGSVGGVPKWVFWAAGGWLAYTAITSRPKK